MPALTRLALAEPLVRLVGRGGLTPKGVGHSEIRIQPDGKLQGNGTTSNEMTAPPRNLTAYRPEPK
jgi:hypothetical protein